MKKVSLIVAIVIAIVFGVFTVSNIQSRGEAISILEEYGTITIEEGNLIFVKGNELQFMTTELLDALSTMSDTYIIYVLEG